MDSGRIKVILKWAGCLALAAQTGHARERYEFYNGARQLGMGGAAVAVVNDETALLLNPAGLGKLRGYYLTIADPEAEGGANASKIVGVALGNAFDPQIALNKLNDPGNLAEHHHVKAQVFPSFVVPNFGFGVYGKYSLDAEVNAANTLYTLDYFNDYAAVMGFNFRLFDGIIKLGAAARAINRVSIERTDIPSNSIGLTVKNLASEGIGVGADVGLIIAAPVALLPTVAAVLRDAGDTSYNVEGGLFTGAITVPVHTKQTVDVGVALFPIMSRRSRAVITFEMRDVMDVHLEQDDLKRYHAGIELNFADAVFLRAGYNQRYFTAGIEIQMQNYQLQAATYGEEIGTAILNREDRRYVFKFALRF